jgi:hypothetical protein
MTATNRLETSISPETHVIHESIPSAVTDQCIPTIETNACTPLSQSQAAFLSALPNLLKHHAGEWVAFADGKMVRLGNTRVELFRHCLNDLGMTHDRFVVRRIIPESSPQIEHNLR